MKKLINYICEKSYMFDPKSIPHGFVPPFPFTFHLENRTRLIEWIKTNRGLKKGSYALFQSNPTYMNNHDDDTTGDQVMEPNFFYLFGHEEYQDLFGIIEMDTGKATLAVRNSTPIERAIEKMPTDKDQPESLGVDHVIT
jgi:hypothetical protein